VTLPHKCSARRYSKEWRALFSTFNPAGSDHWKRVLPLLLAMPLAVGCSETDGIVDLDLDDDFHSIGPEDCNDLDATIYLGAPDSCDGVDSNCEGIDDEADADGDGWMICEGDCDDTRENVFPGAPDPIDGLDADCAPNSPPAGRRTSGSSPSVMIEGDRTGSEMGLSQCADDGWLYAFDDADGLVVTPLDQGYQDGDVLYPDPADRRRVASMNPLDGLRCMGPHSALGGDGAVAVKGALGGREKAYWNHGDDVAILTNDPTPHVPAMLAIEGAYIVATLQGPARIGYEVLPTTQNQVLPHQLTKLGPGGIVVSMSSGDLNDDAVDDVVIAYEDGRVVVFDGMALVEDEEWVRLLRVDLEREVIDAAIATDLRWGSAPELVIAGRNGVSDGIIVAVVDGAQRGTRRLVTQLTNRDEKLVFYLEGVTEVTLLPMGLKAPGFGSIALGFPQIDEVMVLPHSLATNEGGDLRASPGSWLEGASGSGYGTSLAAALIPGSERESLCVGMPDYMAYGAIECVLADWD
jgi:hypothetical protein